MYVRAARSTVSRLLTAAKGQKEYIRHGVSASTEACATTRYGGYLTDIAARIARNIVASKGPAARRFRGGPQHM